MTAVASVLGFVAIPVVTSIGGAVVAARRPAGERVRNIVQHVAAGLVFAAASLELLPDLIREHSKTGTVIGFVVGVAAMLILGRMSDHFETVGGQKARHRGDCSGRLRCAPRVRHGCVAVPGHRGTPRRSTRSERHPLATATFLLGFLGILLISLSTGGPT